MRRNWQSLWIPGDVRAQLDSILSSAAFAKAERARKFLRFVVEMSLAGRNTEIKESVIGVEILGRPASFDPRTDPIVRVEAGRLRTRLDKTSETMTAVQDVVSSVARKPPQEIAARRRLTILVNPGL